MCKKIFLLIFFVFFLTNSEAKQLTNNVVVSIDNSIITDLDINKEINFLKFINKDQAASNPELLKKEIVNSLIDRKIKDIETNYFKIEVSEKEIEINLYNYLERIKINASPAEPVNPDINFNLSLFSGTYSPKYSSFFGIK